MNPWSRAGRRWSPTADRARSRPSTPWVPTSRPSTRGPTRWSATYASPPTGTWSACTTAACVVRRTAARGNGVISTMELADLEDLDFASWKTPWAELDDERPDVDPEQNKVLTLRRLLETVASYPRPVELAIETKHPTRYAGLVERRLARLLDEFGWAGADSPVRVMSFSWVALRRVRRLAPDLRLVMLRRQPVVVVPHPALRRQRLGGRAGHRGGPRAPRADRARSSRAAPGCAAGWSTRWPTSTGASTSGSRASSPTGRVASSPTCHSPDGAFSGVSRGQHAVTDSVTPVPTRGPPSMPASAPPWPNQQDLTLPFAAESAHVAREHLVSWLEGLPIDAEARDDARLVISELIGNAVRHARPLGRRHRRGELVRRRPRAGHLRHRRRRPHHTRARSTPASPTCRAVGSRSSRHSPRAGGSRPPARAPPCTRCSPCADPRTARRDPGWTPPRSSKWQLV